MKQIAEILMGCWCSLISLFLFICVYVSNIRGDDNKHGQQTTVSILCLAGVNVIWQLSDIFAWTFRGNPSLAGFIMVRISNFIYILLIPTMVYLLMSYQETFLECDFGIKANPIFKRLLKGFLAIYSVIHVLNLFIPIEYHFDEQNLYTRNSGSIIMILIQVICYILLLSESIAYTKEKQKVYMYQNIAGVLSIMVASGYQALFYGITLTNVAVTAGLVAIFFRYYAGKIHQLAIQERELEEKNRKIEEQQQQLVDSQIRLLVSQIQPHFIYNTITMIRQYCYTNPEIAADSLGKFAKFLRVSLTALNSRKPQSLQKELAVVDAFIYLEEKRYGDRIHYHKEINLKPEEMNLCEIPTLSIQPIIENAVKYGIEDGEDGGDIYLRIHREDSQTVIRIEDNGNGFDAERLIDETTHVGLANVRRRLEYMCHGTMKIESRLGEGTRVTLIIPDKQQD